MKRNTPKHTEPESQPKGATPNGQSPSSAAKAKASRWQMGFGWLKTGFMNQEKVRNIAAVFLLLFSVFLLVSFVSHLLYAGEADQSTYAEGVFVSPDSPAAINSAGVVGAWFAARLITNGFGVIMLLFPFYLALIAYCIAQNKYWHIVRYLFIVQLFSYTWLASTIAFFTTVINNQFLDGSPSNLFSVDLGGGIGNAIVHFLSFYIGLPGTGFILLFLLLVFITLKFNNYFSFLGFTAPYVEPVNAFLAKVFNITEPTPIVNSNPSKPEAPTDKEHTTITYPDADFDIITNFVIDPKLTVEDKVEDDVIITVSRVENNTATQASPITASQVTQNIEQNFPPVATDALSNSIDDDFTVITNTITRPKNTTESKRDIELIIENPVNTQPTPYYVPTPKAATETILDISYANQHQYEPPLYINNINNINNNAVEFHDDDDDNIEFGLKAPSIQHSTTTPNIETALSSDNIVEVEDEIFVRKIAPEDIEIEEGLISDIEWAAYDPLKELSRYVMPSPELLKQYENPANREIDRAELEANKNKIIETLSNYGIDIVSIKATVGPTVTLYEIIPAAGVRISKIKNLEDDITLSLSALSTRIIAPIPGKGTIGIEIPNSKPETVSFRSVIATEKFIESKAALPIAIGKTISNEVFIADLAKMPHLLVAGSTGQGKSVGLNCIIASLLYKKHPSQIKFVLIDPKKVEMTLYQAIEYHYLAKLPHHESAIVTDNKEVIHVLNSLCLEMDNRYLLLQKARVRNIEEYNQRFIQRRLNPKNGHQFLPYIVLVIDELADLMMTAGKEIETPIARLAQLARAVGIHLVVATQRPSVNVITGVIKANFPARMSYRVISKTDSRTILDANGAEQLIGRGDLLLFTGSELVRIQNAFMNTDEVEKLVHFISQQPGYSEPFYLPEVPNDNEDDDDLSVSLGGGSIDPVFEDAARLIVSLQLGSTSKIQQKMSLGYNRAARIMDLMEKVGIVGAANGSKPRQVLVHDMQELERILRNLDKS